MAEAKRKSSTIANELVRTTQTDCWSPVSSHLLSAEKVVPQATMRQSEDMAPARRKFSAIENVLSRTAQTDCESPVSSHLLTAEKAMPQATPPTSLDILGQSQDMPPGKMKISSAIGNELAMLQATRPASSDIVGPLEDMAPGQRALSSAIGNELVRTPQADCRSPVSSLLSVGKVVSYPGSFFNMVFLDLSLVVLESVFSFEAMLQATPPASSDTVGQVAMLLATPPASSDTVGQLEDMAPARRKISSVIENATTPQADCRSSFCSHFLSLEKDRPEESTSVPNQNLTPTIIQDVNSTFHKVESFLKSIPEEHFLSLSGTPISNLESAKEIVRHFVGGPLKMLADPANEKALKEAISLLNDNLSSFTDEQSRLLVKIKHIFPSMVKDLRDSSRTESSCQDFFTDLGKDRKTLDDLRSTDMELKLKYDQEEAEEKEMETMLMCLRNRKAEILEKRHELSVKANHIMSSAEEKVGKIEDTKILLVKAKDKIDSLKRQWSSLKPVHL